MERRKFLRYVGAALAAGLTRAGAGSKGKKSYITIRSGLPNARIRFTRDKAGRVAFLGGSITQMKGWREMVGESLQKRFRDTKFDFINAGIGSTDTAMGPFRLGRDVFTRGRVDLLFVEFAVNDHTNGRSETESIRGMEGIVRQARRRNPEIDIVMLHLFDADKDKLCRAGKTVPTIVSHEKVAAHYCIPSINLARQVSERLAAGEFDMRAFGGTHPRPFGHRLYTRAVEHLLDAAWGAPVPDGAGTRPHPTPRPLDPLNYERGRLVDIRKAVLESGWRLEKAWKPRTGRTRPGFVNVPMLVANKPAAQLKLKFTGTAVGIIVPAGPDVGVLEFRIDGGPAQTVDQFTRWSSRLHIPWVYMLRADLTDSPHELTLRTSDRKNKQSTGHAARIVHFVVNGPG